MSPAKVAWNQRRNNMIMNDEMGRVRKKHI
jgi:hypothetical protein